jgi:peptidyl-prolyl cis-trans isomerase A (cyclophilin A)
MTTIWLLAALAASLFAAPAAQTAGDGDVLVRIETALGAIDIAVDSKRAPVTAANFLKYVDGKFYDGGRFHRATRPDNDVAVGDKPAIQVIQAGINPARRADAFPAIPLERTSATGLRHLAGTASMARAATTDSARSDFFICVRDEPSLDAGGKRAQDGQGFAAFGRVVQGMHIVRGIQQQPVEKQALTPPIAILRMSRIQ